MSTSHEQAQAVAASLAERYLNAELSSIKLIEGRGEVNEVYELSAAGKKAVLRLHDHTELTRYQKEAWCSAAAGAKGVPTPKVLYVGHDHKCAFMLMEFIAGTNGTTIKDTNDTWYTLGQYLHQIHSVAVTGFGDTLQDITSGNTTQWQEYLKSNIQALSDKQIFIEQGILTTVQAGIVQNHLKRLIGKNFAFGLNHGDYSLANIIVNDEGSPYVIDWGSAQAHIVPHHDLSVILEESLEEDSEKYLSLLSGYGMIRQDYPQISAEIRLLQLLDAVDKVRWAIDKAPHRLNHHADRLSKFVAQVELQLR